MNPPAARKILKCLSIRPAWAWTIIHLQARRWKDVENRSWTTKHLGPLLIHASKGLTREEYGYACERALTAGPAKASQLPSFEDVGLFRGRLIGAVQLTDVAPPGKVASPWHVSECYGWQLTRRVAFEPRPLPGKLSLFDVEVTAAELEALRGVGLV